MLKVAFIGGYGHQGYAFSGAFAHPEARIEALAATDAGDPIPGSRGRVAERQGAPVPVFDDYRRMLDEIRPDVVSVSPVYGRNGEICRECVERGVHVFSEKPVAASLDELNALRSGQRRAGVHFAGMHAMRYCPAFAAAHRAVSEGRIGRPLLFTGQKSYAFTTSRPDFYRERATYGGSFCWVAIHAIDWAFWMLGDFETIYASHTTRGNLGYGACESSGAMAFRFAGGGQGAIHFDFLKAHRDKIPQDRCRIAGEKGTIEVGDERAYLCTHEEERHELPLEEKRSFFAEFLDQVLGRGACRISAEETFAVTRGALLARESADRDILVRTADFPFSGSAEEIETRAPANT